jgi:hypothetical protein
VPGVTAESMMAAPDVLVVEETFIAYAYEPESLEDFMLILRPETFSDL